MHWDGGGATTQLEARPAWDTDEEEFEDFVGLPPEITSGPGSGSTGNRSGWPYLKKLSLTKPSPRSNEPSFLVDLNVGGELFRTTASTLMRTPFFERLLGEDGGEMGIPKTADGHYFIDRPGTYFSIILEYLRMRQWPVDSRMEDPCFLEALRDEANFYGIDKEEQLPPLRIPEYVTIWQFREDTALYIDCLEQTLRDDPDHQGSFRLCKYFGVLPLDAKTNTKRFKASTQSLHSVLAYFAARGWSLNHIVEGSLITHTTSADGQSRTGHGVQYILVKYGPMRLPSQMSNMDIPFPPDTQRTYGMEGTPRIYSTLDQLPVHGGHGGAHSAISLGSTGATGPVAPTMSAGGFRPWAPQSAR